MPAIKLYPVQVFVSNKFSGWCNQRGYYWCFRNRISSFSLVQILLKTCHEILVLEVLEIIIVGKGLVVFIKGLVVFSKGLVVFITSSNCRWKSLSEKEYDEYAHNKI